MERELQQIQYENSNLAEQLLHIRADLNSSIPKKKEEFGLRFEEKDQLVDLLKRNHDIVLEKYET